MAAVKRRDAGAPRRVQNSTQRWARSWTQRWAAAWMTWALGGLGGALVAGCDDAVDTGGGPGAASDRGLDATGAGGARDGEVSGAPDHGGLSGGDGGDHDLGATDPGDDATATGDDGGPAGGADGGPDLGAAGDAEAPSDLDVAPDIDAETAPPAPVDCDVYAGRAGRQLCAASAEACEVVFTDRAGCAATCAEAGLVCAEALENLDDRCGADRARPALDCATDSGHASDWCRCVRPVDCTPVCDGRSCGSDGCGGRCGPGCAGGETCEAGRCVEAAVECVNGRPSPASLLAERVGFGARATGGDPARIYRVTSGRDGAEGSLRAALESEESWWIVFDIEGEIRFDFDRPIRVRSNKTVDGRGRDVRLRDARFNIRDGARNLIFSDFEAYFNNPQDNVGDLFSLTGPGGEAPADYPVRRVWFHHLDLHHAGDGLIDVRGASEITISWNHFHDHTKVMLHTKDADNRASPGMRITYHHNFFNTVTRRSPHFAYGLADFFNNYHKHWYEYGAASIDEARFLSEGNVYEARPGDFCVVPCPDPAPHGGGNDFFVSKKAVSNDWAPDQTLGYVKSVGDLLLNGAVVAVRQPERVFNRADHYVANVDAATPELARRIEAEAGPRRTLCR